MKALIKQITMASLLVVCAGLAACGDDSGTGVVSTSNATTDTSNATTDTSNATTDTSNATTDTSNATTDTSNATTGTSNATTGTSNATTGTSNATTGTSNATTGTMLGTIPEELEELGNHTILLAALDEAQLRTTLDGDGPYTVLAPTDEAIEALLSALEIDAAALLASQGLEAILLNHVLNAIVLSSEISDGQTVMTLAGETLTFAIDGDVVIINDVATVTLADVEASNGVIHVIDAVLTLPEAGPGTIPEVLTERGNHTTLLAAVTTAGLAETLSDSEGTFTVFAPTDAAFEALLAALEIDAEALLASEGLDDILLNHVLNTVVMSSELSDGQVVTNLAGETLTFAIDGDVVTINGVATVTAADVEASNGVIHVIDAVLTLPDPGPGTIPEVLTDRGDHTTLLAAVTTAGLAETLSDSEGTFTVFAPTDAAFEALLAALEIDAATLLASEDLGDILLNHVLNTIVMSSELSDGQVVTNLAGETLTFAIDGDVVTINGVATVTVADVEASNGVIHVIDAVLTLPDPGPGTIPEVLTDRGDHTTLLAAVTTAGLAETLSDSEGTFTVFAPTDAAFEALLAALEIDAAALLASEDLGDILLNHVLNTIVMSSELSDGQVVTNLAGETLTFAIDGDVVTINGVATVTVADVEASNGVIHVIDAVIIQPLPTILEILETRAVHNGLLLSLEAAELTEVLSGEGPFTLFAPTDAGFQALLDASEITFQQLLNASNLDLVLLSHVLDGIVTGSDITDGVVEVTLGGNTLTFTFDGSGGVSINDSASFILTDLEASNGVVHIIDAVLIPPPLITVVDVIEQQDDMTILLEALETADLTDVLRTRSNSYTVFAPTDAALETFFSNFELTVDDLLNSPALSFILLNHVLPVRFATDDFVDGQLEISLNSEELAFGVSDGRITINGTVGVESRNLEATNGVVHPINGILAPFVVRCEGSQNPEDSTQVEGTVECNSFDEGYKFDVYTFNANAGDCVFITADNVNSTDTNGVADLLAVLLDQEGVRYGISPDFSELDDEVECSNTPATEFACPAASVTTRLTGEMKVAIAQWNLPETDGCSGSSPYTLSVSVNGSPADLTLQAEDTPVNTVPQLSTVFSIVQYSESHTILEDALLRAGFDAELAAVGEGDYTLFAPTDEAFIAAGIDDVSLIELPDLANILLKHVLVEKVTAADINDGLQVQSALDDLLTFGVDGDSVTVNNATVTTADILAQNGVVHVVDEILLPNPTIFEALVSRGEHELLLSLLDEVGFADELQTRDFGPITIFAPTDAALEQLMVNNMTPGLAEILLYHLADGRVLASDISDGLSLPSLSNEPFTFAVSDAGAVTINGAVNVLVTDIETANGVIHIIDAVLTEPAQGTIIDELKDLGERTALLSAIEAAGLTGTLQGDGPFTVFAPTDAAFTTFGDSLGLAFDGLLQVDNLGELLLNHVVDGALVDADITSLPTLTSLAENDLVFTLATIDDIDYLVINDVALVLVRKEASNGVIYGVNGIISLP